jgi:hypothetical protein
MSLCNRAGLAVLLARFVLFCGAPTPANGNLIQNPSFEDTGTTGVTPTTAVAVGAGSQIPGWTTTLSGASGADNYIAGTNQTGDNWIPPASDGNYSVQLDSIAGTGNYTVGNSIYQAVNLTANTSYSLTFDFRGESVQQAQQAFLNAYVSLDSKGNVPQNASSLFYIAAANFQTPNSNGNPDSLWSHATLTFNTGSNSGLIRFTFMTVGGTSVDNTGGTDDNDISLDNFNLVVVPEYTHWAVWPVFGLLVIGLHARERIGSVTQRCLKAIAHYALFLARHASKMLTESCKWQPTPSV